MTSLDALATLLEVFFKIFWPTDTQTRRHCITPAMHAHTHARVMIATPQEVHIQLLPCSYYQHVLLRFALIVFLRMAQLPSCGLVGKVTVMLHVFCSLLEQK